MKDRLNLKKVPYQKLSRVHSSAPVQMVQVIHYKVSWNPLRFDFVHLLHDLRSVRAFIGHIYCRISVMGLGAQLISESNT